MTTITDISHYDLFRILDYMKTNCEIQNGNESVDAIKYADIFNLAATCKIFRRIVWDWSKSMYRRLELDLLHVLPHKNLTVKFIEIHETLKRATKQKRDRYMDIYIGAMMGNPLLKTIELSYNTQKFISTHESIFEEIVKGLQGKADRIILDPYKIPKFKEIIVDIGDRRIENLGLFRNISKLSLKAHFEMIDLEEFCSNNPSLVTLEVNVNRFSDHGKLAQIVRHCPNLKQLKFLLNDNVTDNSYVGLALLDKLTQLEIDWKPIFDEVQFYLDEVEDWHRAQDLEMDEDFTIKRPRMDTEYESLLTGVSDLQRSIPVLQLLKAFSEKKKSKLIQLCLKFDIDDEMVQVIANIKGLRMLECGFCDPRSIRHLKGHPTLNRLTMRNKGHLVSEDIADLLSKQVTVSSFDTKMFFSSRGHLSIFTRDAQIFRFVSFEPFLQLENLKSLRLPVEMIVSMESTLHLFLELGVQIKSEACDIDLDPKKRSFKIMYDREYFKKELALPLVNNVRSFKLLSINMPTCNIFLKLAKHNLQTLNEIYISSPFTIFENSKDTYLTQSVVEALVTLSCLRKISCLFQKFIYILPLAQLKDLVEIEVLSEHHPKDIYFPRCLEPLLQNCRKLSSFQIKVPTNGITKKFLKSLQATVIANRDPDMQEDLQFILNLKCATHKTKEELMSAPNMTENQIKLITRPFERMKLTTKYIENDYFFD
ncbi:LOW QUALITY PROTEIN: uncharacterized protein LOC128257942 [Drosophila gunungcola]|uniref:LOW QUALITY PROTEIN: uncharacterized protein LOC128257942 n=1 Tax=Drosophila gunungcola TaxID=103775 RepID=UPI0022E11E26|nr:LOW QUALITY PROTEIN: uncharacterized protein LOC128257942 [Drosophila gunungcola]